MQSLQGGRITIRGSVKLLKALSIAKTLSTTILTGKICSGGEGEGVNGVGGIVSGNPPGGGGSITGGGSVGFICSVGACGLLGGRYGPDFGPVLNLLNCFSGIQGGTYPRAGVGQLGEPFFEGAGDGHSQLINFCHRLGSI